MTEEQERKDCLDHAHYGNLHPKLLGQTCAPCMECNNRRLRSEIKTLTGRIEILTHANKAQAEVISELRAKIDWYGESESVRVTEERKAREAAEARCADQSALIVEIGAKLNATKLREEGLESALSAKDAELGRAREAFQAETLARSKTLEAYEARRKTFDHMADCEDCRDGMTALCNGWEKLMWDAGGQDFQMDEAGLRAALPQPDAEPTGSCHYLEAKIIRSMCESCAPLPNPPVDCPVCYWFDDSGRKFSFYAPAPPQEKS